MACCLSFTSLPATRLVCHPCLRMMLCGLSCDPVCAESERRILYTAPMTFVMQDFKQVQASVFQVSRAPGKTIVYIGCFFLILGVFAMLYVRERRVCVAGSGQPS